MTENNNLSFNNKNDILENLKYTQTIIQYMYQETQKLDSTSYEKLDKILPHIHKIRAASNDAIVDFIYHLFYPQK